MKKSKIISLIILVLLMIATTVFASDYENHWAYDSIEYLKGKAIVQGDEYGNVNPDNNITRAEFVTIVNKSMNFTETGSEQYTDISSEQWYAYEFLKAKRYGYIKGDESGNANPNADITRAEVSVILSRILLIASEEEVNFVDKAEIPEWAYKGISGLIKVEVIQGYEDNTFKPNNNITRGEAITLITRVLKNEEAKKEKNEALQELKENNKDMGITYRENGDIGIITDFTLEGAINSNNDVKKALEQIKDIYGIKNVEEEFKVLEKVVENRYDLQQMYKGIEVYGRQIILVLNENKEVNFVNSTYVKNINISTTPEISEDEAKSRADEEVVSTELIVYIKDNKPVLAWKVNMGLKVIIVNAKTGEVIATEEYIFGNYTTPEVQATGKEVNGQEVSFMVQKYNNQFYLTNNRIEFISVQTDNLKYDSNGEPIGDITQIIMSKDNNWSGKLNIFNYKNKETEYTKNSIVGERLGEIAVTTYNNVIQSYDFYSNVLKDTTYKDHKICFVTEGQEKVNNAAAAYYTTDHEKSFIILGIDTNYENKYSNNKNILDDSSMGIYLDVVGHEMTHLVSSKIANWYGTSEDKIREARTLNEGYADIMSELIEIYYNEDDDNWNTGNAIGVFRSASDPEKYGYPSKIGGQHFDPYYIDPHNNMTVITHAAYLMHKNGISDEVRLAKLWYGSLKYMPKDFETCRIAVLKSAREMNMTEDEIQIISNAFDKVGIIDIIDTDFSVTVENKTYTSDFEINASELNSDYITFDLAYGGNGIIEGWYVHLDSDQKLFLGKDVKATHYMSKSSIPALGLIKFELKLEDKEAKTIQVKFINTNNFSVNIGNKKYTSSFELSAKELPKNITVEYTGNDIIEGIYLTQGQAKPVFVGTLPTFTYYISEEDIPDFPTIKHKIVLRNSAGETYEKEIAIRFTDVKQLYNAFNIEIDKTEHRYFVNDIHQETTLTGFPANVILEYEYEGTIESWYMSNGENEIALGNDKTVSFVLNESDFGNSSYIEISLKIKEREERGYFKIYKDNSIAVKYGEKDYEATEENPIREGVYLGHIVVKNCTGKAIKEWQLWSQKEHKYVTCEGTENEKLMYLGLENYNKKAHDIYEIKVKAIFEDGSELIREIYHKMVRIESPTNQEVVSANKDLEIKWNGEKGRKYHVRMVKYYTAEKGNLIQVEEIEPGVIWEGSSYIIDKSKLEENACYRIAVKEAEGQYHDIIVISTSDKLEGTIENYNEIKESKEGESVSVKLSGREKNDKYLLVIYKENGQILKRLEASTDRFEIIRAEQATKGTYKLELSIIRGGITHKANTYEVTIK